MLAEIRRPIYWIFVRSPYFDEVFRPRLEAAGAASAGIHLYPRTEPSGVDTTIQVLDDESILYPVAPKTALTTPWDIGRQTWDRQRIAA